MELEEGALGNTHVFDLVGRTLRFMPEGSRYRVENRALHWDSDFGPELAGSEVTLHQFAFPFSGKPWNSFLVGTNGSIRFGTSEKDIRLDPYGRVNGGVSLGRFDQLAEAASTLIDSAPAICVFLKPRMSGPDYVKELPDRVVITWDLTEPFGGFLDFMWFKTINRFQAELHRDGSIEMSYKELAAKDAIVGIYPVLSGQEKPLATITAKAHPSLPPHLDVQRVKLSILDATLLRVTFETRGPVPPEGDRAMEGIGYRVDFDAPDSHSGLTAAWIIKGRADPDDPSGGRAKYYVFSAGVSPKVRISGNSIAVEGVLPAELRAAEQVAVSAKVITGGDHAKVVEQLSPHPVRLSGIRTPEVHLSSVTRKDGPFAVVYESFHYLAPPRPQDLSCTVIKTLGDEFDFMAYYSDFRIDSQEASSPSEGPFEDNVMGIGQAQHYDLESYCTRGRLQLVFQRPVYVDSNGMQERPPKGAPVGNIHDITFYTHQIAEGSPDGRLLAYNYAMSQLGHEVGHRWAAYVSAKVKGKTISLGFPHWELGLQAPVAFPYSRPTEASTMGGGVWQDNFDGTYSQLRDGWFVPATGYSYLDLYLMGLITAAEVPDFFILKNLVPVGKDASGYPIFKAERTKVTIQDVIAAEGPHLPDVDHSQRKFNTGIVVVVEHGKTPSHELIERADGIRQQWIDYWETTTGHRASMATNPH